MSGQRNRYTRYANFLDEDSSNKDRCKLLEIALCLDMHHWAQSGNTPIWMRISQKERVSLGGLQRRLDSAGWLPCRRESDFLWIPIELSTGTEYEDVLDEATRQVKSVRDIIITDRLME